MLPNKNTEFKPLSEIGNYSDGDKYFCTAVVFSPETENNHFEGCPPYIRIQELENFDSDNDLYFEVPEIVAYYAKTHPCYTMRGNKNNIKKGERQLADKIKALLNIK